MSALNEANIKKFVADWYYSLDIHASAAQCETMLVDQGLQLVFPEKTMRTYAEFEGWLSVIYSTFFDELHNVVKVEIKNLTETSADLDVVVAWQASWFTPPDAKSKRTSMNAFQRWVIVLSDKNPYGLAIEQYFVDRFDYAPGFAQL
jgi:hypothetical protein